MKDPNVIMKKTKLPTQSKSKPCSHSKCPYPAARSLLVENRLFRLCKKHLSEYENKNEKHNAIFTKAVGWL